VKRIRIIQYFINSSGTEGSQPASAVAILCSGKQIIVYLSVLVIKMLKPESGGGSVLFEDYFH